MAEKILVLLEKRGKVWKARPVNVDAIKGKESELHLAVEDKETLRHILGLSSEEDIIFTPRHEPSLAEKKGPGKRPDFIVFYKRDKGEEGVEYTLSVLELKSSGDDRKVIAQTLEYLAKISKLSSSEDFVGFLKNTFNLSTEEIEEKFQELIAEGELGEINTEAIILAPELCSETKAVVEYLATYGVPLKWLSIYPFNENTIVLEVTKPKEIESAKRQKLRQERDELSRSAREFVIMAMRLSLQDLYPKLLEDATLSPTHVGFLKFLDNQTQLEIGLHPLYSDNKLQLKPRLSFENEQKAKEFAEYLNRKQSIDLLVDKTPGCRGKRKCRWIVEYKERYPEVPLDIGLQGDIEQEKLMKLISQPIKEALDRLYKLYQAYQEYKGREK